MVKNSSALQCLHCAKFIANSIFTNHLQGCINQSNSNGSQNNNSSSNHVNLTNTINSSISSSIMNSSSLMHLPGMGSSNQMGGSSSTYHHQNNPSSSSSSSNAHHHEHGVGRGMSSNGSVSVNNSFLNGVPPLFMNLDPNGLQISINQTMVRESPDN